MTNTCVVFNCMSGSGGSDEPVYLFHVPSDPVMQQKWAQAIPQTKEPLATDSLVCHKHFLESDINRYDTQKNEKTYDFTKVPYDYPKLNDAAVPSIFPGYETQSKVEGPTEVLAQAAYYADGVRSVATELAFYSALSNLTHHRPCHQVGNLGTANVPSEASNPVTNPPSNDISTTIAASPPEIVPRASTNLVTNAPQPADHLQNVTNGIGESSAPTGVETVSPGIAGSPDVLANGTAGTVDQIVAPSVDPVSNGVSDPGTLVDSAMSQGAPTIAVDATNNTTDLASAVTAPTSGWDNVIANEPVSGAITKSAQLIPSDPTVDVDGNHDCWGDDCCGDDCCCDDCCCGADWVGDLCCGDCGGCVCTPECIMC